MSEAGKALRPEFSHLAALTDDLGLHEHAQCSRPRPDHGYCVDDVARGLIVTCREPRPDAVVRQLRDQYLDFVLAAVRPDGCCHNRMNRDGDWTDEASNEDWWGRAVWALGVAAAHPEPSLRGRALAGFDVVSQQRSPFSRSMAFAALGAGEVLRSQNQSLRAESLLCDAVRVVDRPPAREAARAYGWIWPEPRLRYANATVAESLIEGGDILRDAATRTRGLRLLMFLLRVETRDRHLSITPVGGRGPNDAGPAFDQQPIEVAAIADASATAYRVTSDPRWLGAISMCWRWFLGDNDSGIAMFDPLTGGGYDGLEAGGRNLNQGAESTLAMLSTAQHVRHSQGLR